MNDDTEIDIVVEADASAVVETTDQAVAAFSKILDQVRQLENGLERIFTQQLPMGVQQLQRMAETMQQVQRIPQLPSETAKVNQARATSGGSAAMQSRAFSGVLRDLRADPAIQALRYETEANKVLEAREQIYRRLRAAMPGASEEQLLSGYRQTLGSLGAEPSRTVRAGPKTTNAEIDEARVKRAKFFAETEAETQAFNKKLATEYLAAEAKKYEEANLLYERMMRSRAIRTTPEEAERRAQELTAYGARRGQVIDPDRLRAAYVDQHEKELAIRGSDPLVDAEARVRQLYERRDAGVINRQFTSDEMGMARYNLRDANLHYKAYTNAPAEAATAERQIVQLEQRIADLKAKGTAEQQKGIGLLDQEIMRLREVQAEYIKINAESTDTIAVARARSERLPNSGRPAKTQEEMQQSDEARVRQRLANRQAGLDYMGGAPMLGIEAHTMANYALMGGAIGGVAYAGKSVLDFQNGLDGIKADAGATDGEMARLAKDIMAVGSASSQSMKDLTDATDLLVKAGYGVQQAGVMLKPISQLATATKSTAKDAADVTTEVMKVYNLAASQAPMVTNALAEIATRSKVSLADVGTAFKSAGQFAQGTGMQFNEVLAAFGAMAKAGMKDGAQLGTGLRSLISNSKWLCG